MNPLRLYPPCDFLLEGIAQDIDPMDRDELALSNNSDDVLEVIKTSRDYSFECAVAVANDVPIAIYGIALLDNNGTWGCPWAVFTNEMRKYPKELMKASRMVLERWKRMFPYLENWVDPRNERAIRWLKRLGFTVFDDQPANGEFPLYRFEMRNV